MEKHIGHFMDYTRQFVAKPIAISFPMPHIPQILFGPFGISLTAEANYITPYMLQLHGICMVPKSGRQT